MIYLYAITEPDAEPPACGGFEGHVVERLGCGEVAALGSEHDQLELRPTPDVLWRHDQVVEEAMKVAPALPARFGTTFESRAAVASSLERESPQLRRRLERVRGCVELAVRVSLPTAVQPSPRDGGEYVRVKLAERRDRREAAARTLAPLAELAVGWHQAAGRSETGTLSASYLVRAGEVKRFADAVRTLQAHNSGLSLSCTGPWPPYSFVGEDDQ